MIDKESILRYRGEALERGASYIYLSPDSRLLPYIANYTLTCPLPEDMPDQYTVMPSASATLVFAAGDHALEAGLRGVNTRASMVGAYANRHRLLLLIEFHPGGLYPLLGIDQRELLDASFDFSLLHGRLHTAIQDALLAAGEVAALKAALDRIFLHALTGTARNGYVMEAMRRIVVSHGVLPGRALAQAMFYSEKHLGRLFQRHVGVGVKTFSRIVRVNYALRLLSTPQKNLSGVAAEAGYFDQPHFIHDFRALCGVTPQAYLQGMSLFYNDSYKP